jgi:DNA polymerase-1
MKQEIGYPFNPASSQDLQKILFEDLGYTPIKESQKTQLPSTDADVLNELNRQKESPFLTQLLGYRKLTKCKSTYLENWLKMSEKTGKIHCNFNLNGTATGRLSSSSPNLYVGGCKSY